MMGINGIYNPGFAQADGSSKSVSARDGKGSSASFGELLKARMDDSLNFSKHASRRLEERGIAVDSQLLGRLEHAVKEARRKGARDVAVIGSQGVFIVNVPNNVVVTTMTQDDMKDRVFTNIDIAVLM